MAERVDVRAIRESLELSREEFRQLFPASNRTVRRWENHEVEPSQMALKRLRELETAARSDGPKRREVQS